jgi:hypothetical protein
MCKIYDHIIIGGGISGTYLFNRLNKIFINDHILLIEKTDRLCGRLKSINDKKMNKNDIAYELGAMRIYPKVHPLFNDLLNELIIDKRIVNELDDNNIAYVKKNTFKTKYLNKDSRYLYNINDNEDVNDIIKNVYDNLLHYNLSSYEKKIDIYNNISLSSFNFKNIAKKNISDELWEYYKDISGYSQYINRDINFITTGINSIQFKQQHDHYFIVGSTQNICHKLLINSSQLQFNDIFISSIDYNNLNHVLNVNVNKIFKINNNLYELNIENIENIIDTEEFIYSVKNNKTIYGKNIYLAIQKMPLKYIYDWDKQFIKILENLFDPYSVIKIGLKFNENFWNKYGINEGKIITTTQEKQIWVYDNTTLLIYSPYYGYDELYQYFPDKIQIKWMKYPTNYLTTNYVIDEIIHKNLLLIFKNYTQIIPKPSKIAWYIWHEGVNFWKPIKFKYYNVSSFNKLKDKIFYPLGKNNSLFIVNNDFSVNQGWIEGSLEDVNYLLNKLYNYNV